MKAFVFPGQGAQYPGMGKDFYDNYSEAKSLFDQADKLLNFNISEVMFNGTPEDLKQTHITQPAVFICSFVDYKISSRNELPDMVAGHSLGEFTALVANGVLSFEDALLLVSKRANAMQNACNAVASGMAVVLGFDDNLTAEICNSIDEVVVPANYNSPAQLVISGSITGLEAAIAKLKDAGARKVMMLNVGGAFHSPLMLPAQNELAESIEKTTFHKPFCPIYQNCTALPSTDPIVIKQNLLKQLTSPVLWSQSVQNMILDGANYFKEFGPGDVLKGLIRKIDPKVITE